MGTKKLGWTRDRIAMLTAAALLAIAGAVATAWVANQPWTEVSLPEGSTGRVLETDGSVNQYPTANQAGGVVEVTAMNALEGGVVRGTLEAPQTVNFPTVNADNSIGSQEWPLAVIGLLGSFVFLAAALLMRNSWVLVPAAMLLKSAWGELPLLTKQIAPDVGALTEAYSNHQWLLYGAFTVLLGSLAALVTINREQRALDGEQLLVVRLKDKVQGAATNGAANFVGKVAVAFQEASKTSK